MFNSILLITVFLIMSCGSYEDCSDDNSCQKVVSQPTETKVDEKTDDKEKSLQDKLVPQWALTDITFERLMCSDDYADYVDKPQEFCQCLVEKIAIRWTRENWIRYQYSYTKRLASNGSIRRCAIPTDYFAEPETPEMVTEDQQFDPTDAIDDGKTIKEAIEIAVKK